nr:choline transport protein [Quercus suber]
MIRSNTMDKIELSGTDSSPELPRSNPNSGKITSIEQEKPPQTLDPICNNSAEGMAEAMVYTSQLTRSRSTWGVAFMSFVLASVPYGLSTTLIYPLTGGGPVTVIWGWLLVCLLVLCVAISLGEITSVYPLAGGVYYQTYMLSPPSIRSLMAWLTGWSYFLGNVIITLSVNFGTTLFLIGCINVFQDDFGNGIFAAQPYQIYLIFFAITLFNNAVSALANSRLPMLDTAAVVMTFIGVIAIIVCTLAIAAQGRHSASYVFTEFNPTSGWRPSGWAFCVGLLHAAYATSATGMILSMCEEVQKPATQVPKAMVATIILNMVCGFIFLVPLVFVLPDISAVISDPSGQPLPVILHAAIGHPGGAFALCIPIILLGAICGIGCTTAASRCAWAFARDGAIPGSQRLGFDRVNEQLCVPLNAMMLNMVIQLVLGLIYLGSSAAFNAFNGAGVIFLTLSYVIPIAVSFCTGRKKLVGGKFHLGWFGAICNIVSIGWCLLAIPLFSMPSTLPVTLDAMNYASAVFVGGLLTSVLWYVLWGRKYYYGPKMMPLDASDSSDD